MPCHHHPYSTQKEKCWACNGAYNNIAGTGGLCYVCMGVIKSYGECVNCYKERMNNNEKVISEPLAIYETYAKYINSQNRETFHDIDLNKQEQLTRPVPQYYSVKNSNKDNIKIRTTKLDIKKQDADMTTSIFVSPFNNSSLKEENKDNQINNHKEKRAESGCSTCNLL